jgi:hypothetical protein
LPSIAAPAARVSRSSGRHVAVRIPVATLSGSSEGGALRSAVPAASTAIGLTAYSRCGGVSASSGTFGHGPSVTSTACAHAVSSKRASWMSSRIALRPSMICGYRIRLSPMTPTTCLSCGRNSGAVMHRHDASLLTHSPLT